MNQANKALRDFDKLFSVGGRTPIEVTFSTGLPPEGKILQMPFSQFKALVTNHIKGALPEKMKDMNPHDMLSRGKEIGYNQALDEVHQLLKDMGVE